MRWTGPANGGIDNTYPKQERTNGPIYNICNSPKNRAKGIPLSLAQISPKTAFHILQAHSVSAIDAQSGAASLGDLSSFFAPQDDVLTFALTYNTPSAIFQCAKK